MQLKRMTYMMREHAVSIFEAAVAAVQPSHLMQQHVHLEDGVLTVCDKAFTLPAGRPVWIFGAGKAAAAMALALEQTLAAVRIQGIVITKYGHALPLQHVVVREAGHPLPDENGVQATAAMVCQLDAVQREDVVLFLLSGGASALLADYPAGADLAHVLQVSELLLRSGADIHEMNVVRKHLSGVKGGQLPLLADTDTWCSLILSDVVGDDLSVIGSGPTIADPSTFADAVAILDKYNLTGKLSPAVRTHLQDGCAGRIRETPKPGNTGLAHVDNFLIGSNRIALQAAQQKATSLGYTTQVLTSTASGEAVHLAQQLVRTAKEESQKRPACLLMGSTLR